MARGRKPKGLGDTIETITEKTGIKKLVHFIAGEDCGCEERKQKLNELFPYFRTECLTEDEHILLSHLLPLVNKQGEIKPTQQTTLLAIYNRVFNRRLLPTTCGDCWRQYISHLTKLMNEYES